MSDFIDKVFSIADLDGLGTQWNQHCNMHYGQMFQQYETRSELPVYSPSPFCIVDDTVRHIRHEHVIGPVFHGEREPGGVTVLPSFSPFRVFDSSLQMSDRMAQYVDFSCRRSLGTYRANG